jgi:hypothetical protein
MPHPACGNVAGPDPKGHGAARKEFRPLAHWPIARLEQVSLALNNAPSSDCCVFTTICVYFCQATVGTLFYFLVTSPHQSESSKWLPGALLLRRFCPAGS